MKEQFRLNGELVREWKAKKGVKHSYISRELGCSDSYVDKMLGGKVPSEPKLKKLAGLMGVEVHELLLPYAGKKSA